MVLEVHHHMKLVDIATQEVVKQLVESDNHLDNLVEDQKEALELQATMLLVEDWVPHKAMLVDMQRYLDLQVMEDKSHNQRQEFVMEMRVRHQPIQNCEGP